MTTGPCVRDKGASQRIFRLKPLIQNTVSGVRQLVHRPSGAPRRYIREILCVRSEHPCQQTLLPGTTLTRRPTLL
jgi:hypothetical protein